MKNMEEVKIERMPDHLPPVYSGIGVPRRLKKEREEKLKKELIHLNTVNDPSKNRSAYNKYK